MRELSCLLFYRGTGRTNGIGLVAMNFTGPIAHAQDTLWR